MTAKVIGLGAGGHAKVVIEILRSLGDYEVVGMLDVDPQLHGSRILGVEVIGDDDCLPQLEREGIENVFIGVGTENDTAIRTRLYQRAVETGLTVISAIHPAAIVSSSAWLGAGVTVMAGVVVNAEARIGSNVIINTSAVVEHECVISDHAHVATGARLAGQVRVGVGALVGVGCCVRPGVRIGKHAIVGAGAVVVSDIPDNVLAIGTPARTARRLVA